MPLTAPVTKVVSPSYLEIQNASFFSLTDLLFSNSTMPSSAFELTYCQHIPVPPARQARSCVCRHIFDRLKLAKYSFYVFFGSYNVFRRPIIVKIGKSISSININHLTEFDDDSMKNTTPPLLEPPLQSKPVCFNCHAKEFYSS
jgi:hypothetical protein